MLLAAALLLLQTDWRPRKPLPTPAVFAAYAADRANRIYVFAGITNIDDGELTNSTQIYDTRSDSWTTGAPIPTPTISPSAELGSDGRIYVLGGQLKGSPRRATSLNQAYDPKTNQWSTAKPMPSPRMGFAAVSAKDAKGRKLIYAIGGRDYIDPRNGLNTVEAYDPLSDTWTTKAPMPTCRHALCAALAPDGNIYAIGGANHESGHVNTVEIYNPRTDSWQKGPTLNHVVECASLVSTPTQLLLIGGWETLDKADLNRIDALDLKTNTWRQLPNGPFKQAAGGAVALKTRPTQTAIYLLAGTPTGTRNAALTIPSGQ